MSPRKVNKDEKRREVALACSDLMLDIGMRNLTVSKVAKEAGIGKGTVYEYFSSKDDIIFEVINMHIEAYHTEFLKSIENLENTKDKILKFFKFVLDNSNENLKIFNCYKDYLSISLTSLSDEMNKFNKSIDEFFLLELEKVIKDGISKGELKEESMSLVRGLLTYEKGLALLKMTQNDYDTSSNYEEFMNTIFNLIEIKNR